MRPYILLLAALLLAAPAAAQRGPDGPPPRHGPVEILLRNEAELGLTPAQTERLEEIRRAMEERNRPLVARLMEIRQGVHPRRPAEPPTPAQRAELRRAAREARPLMQQIRANNRAAMREVGALLTPEQKERVRELVMERARRRGEGPHRPHGRAHPR